MLPKFCVPVCGELKDPADGFQNYRISVPSVIAYREFLEANGNPPVEVCGLNSRTVTLRARDFSLRKGR